jgi:hypothetical protein
MKTRKTMRRYWLGLLPMLLVLVAGTSQLLAQPSISLKNQASTAAQQTNHSPSPTQAVLLPGSDEEVLRFNALRGEWKPALLKEVAPEGEFLWKNGLYGVRGSARLVEYVPELDVKKLPEADRSYDPSNVRDPVPNDVVWVMGENARHSTVKTLKAGEKFAFQGRVFETKLSQGQMMAGYSGQQLNRVTNTFVKKTDTLIDLTVRNADTGVETVITGTPEHPFFVPAVYDYVELGKLTQGTVLLSESGASVSVVQSETRHGDFEVYNLEVKNQHNYFVSSHLGGAPVLVHNTCNITKTGDNLATGETSYLVTSNAGPATLQAKFNSKTGDLYANMSVHENLRKSGVGTEMLQKAVNEVGPNNVKSLSAVLSGDNLKIYNATGDIMQTPAAKQAAKSGFPYVYTAETPGGSGYRAFKTRQPQLEKP